MSCHLNGWFHRRRKKKREIWPTAAVPCRYPPNSYSSKRKTPKVTLQRGRNGIREPWISLCKIQNAMYEEDIRGFEQEKSCSCSEELYTKIAFSGWRVEGLGEKAQGKLEAGHIPGPNVGKFKKVIPHILFHSIRASSVEKCSDWILRALNMIKVSVLSLFPCLSEPHPCQWRLKWNPVSHGRNWKSPEMNFHVNCTCIIKMNEILSNPWQIDHKCGCGLGKLSLRLRDWEIELSGYNVNQ